MKNVLKMSLMSLVSLSLITGCGCTKEGKTPEEKEKDKLQSEINEDGTLKEEINNNKGVVSDQTVEGITLSDVKFVTTAYTTSVTLKAKNNTSSDITVEYFKAFLKDKNGKNVLGDGEFANVPIYDTIKSGETKETTFNIDRSLSEVTSIEYEMVK